MHFQKWIISHISARGLKLIEGGMSEVMPQIRLVDKSQPLFDKALQFEIHQNSNVARVHQPFRVSNIPIQNKGRIIEITPLMETEGEEKGHLYLPGLQWLLQFKEGMDGRQKDHSWLVFPVGVHHITWLLWHDPPPALSFFASSPSVPLLLLSKLDLR